MKQMKQLIGAFVFSALAVGCGGNDVSIVGKAPEQQADVVISAACEHAASCGNVNIDCTSTDMTIDCTGTIDPVSYDACYADEYADALADFQACNLTAAQEGIIEDCINAVIDQPCVTQAELDAFVVEIEAGNENSTLRPIPAACVQAGAIFEACQPQARLSPTMERVLASTPRR